MGWDDEEEEEERRWMGGCELRCWLKGRWGWSAAEAEEGVVGQ